MEETKVINEEMDQEMQDINKHIEMLKNFNVEEIETKFMKKATYEGLTIFATIKDVQIAKINDKKLEVALSITGEEKEKILTLNKQEMNKFKLWFGTPDLWIGKKVKFVFGNRETWTTSDGKEYNGVRSEVFNAE